MKRLKVLVTGLVLTSLWVNSGLAQVPPFLQDFPQSNRFNVGTPTVPDMRECFDLNNFKLLLKQKADHFQSDVNIKLLNTELSLQTTEIGTLQESLKASANIITIQDQRIDQLQAMWSSENLKRLEAENKPVFGSWLAWGIAGVLAVSTSVMIGAYLAK